MHALRAAVTATARFALTAALALAATTPAPAPAADAPPVASAAVPIAFGETFTIESRILHETRRINVYRAPAWDESTNAKRPLLVMPDGGTAEDFPHVAGLLQVSIGNGSVRPVLLVGIENTERRRDLTGPTSNANDRRIAARVGGSAAFRDFIRDELLPVVAARYPVTDERAIVGESLAGLFVVETFLREPSLFDTYLAFDPSLWWADSALVAAPLPKPDAGARAKSLFLASSSEPALARLTARFAARLEHEAPPSIRWWYEPMPAETHATIYHPAAIRAFRRALGPTP